MKLVISQPMLFPWIGLLEQIRLADVFVSYDDVQFSKGSFVNRVQIKTPSGISWLTVPLQGFHMGQVIRDVQFASVNKWRDKHFGLLRRSFEGAPYADDAIGLAEAVYDGSYSNIGELALASFMALIRYFNLDVNKRFFGIDDLNLPGSGSGRVLAIAKSLRADAYITGHGAANYLDHESFEGSGVQVEYMSYQRKPYEQMHGAFTPYVSGLDLVANCGPEGAANICSGTIPWRVFLNESA